MDILIYIYGSIMSVALLLVIGHGFREWNIGKDNLRKKDESGLTSMLKALFFGLIIVIIFTIIFS